MPAAHTPPLRVRFCFLRASELQSVCKNSNHARGHGLSHAKRILSFRNGVCEVRNLPFLEFLRVPELSGLAITADFSHDSSPPALDNSVSLLPNSQRSSPQPLRDQPSTTSACG